MMTPNDRSGQTHFQGCPPQKETWSTTFFFVGPECSVETFEILLPKLQGILAYSGFRVDFLKKQSNEGGF